MKTQLFSPFIFVILINLFFTVQIHSIDETSYEEYVINYVLSEYIVKVHYESTRGDDLGEVNLKFEDRQHWHITAATETDFDYMCSFLWNDKMQIFDVYNKNVYDKKLCATNKGNNCYRLMMRGGFYFANDNSTRFPGPAWKFVYPWTNWFILLTM